MAMIVVQPGPVGKHSVRAHFLISRSLPPIIEFGIIRIKTKSLLGETPKVGTWRLKPVVPTNKAVVRITPDHCLCVVDLVFCASTLNQEPIFGLDPGEDPQAHTLKTTNLPDFLKPAGKLEEIL